MDFKLYLALVTGKLINFSLKIVGSGATAAPGLYALKVDPNLVKKLSKLIEGKTVLISGTNGKTTTARLLSNILSTKYKIIHNRQGSNLLRGIASTLISHASWAGNLKHELAIWEVDEATLPEAISNLSPKVIVLLNLFRDQLDRYGEVDSVRAIWQKVLSSLPKETTLILNADDPGICILQKSFKGKVVFFGVNDKVLNLPQVESIADVKHCPNCQKPLSFSTILSAHLGHYQCSNCDFRRLYPQFSAQNLKFNNDFSTSAELKNDKWSVKIKYNLPGLYNVYNILAATTATRVLNIKKEEVIKKIQEFSAAFGRFQKISIRGKEIIIFLIKNPAGANEVLRTISGKDKIQLLAILNDKIADGKDVSWIWDTNWEILKGRTNSTFVSGTRSWDLALRLKYAGFSLNKNNIHRDINYSMQNFIKNTNNKSTLVILPTYSSLLEVQRTLHKLGGTAKWQSQ